MAKRGNEEIAIKRAVFYGRVSTIHEQQDNSIQNQRNLCEIYLKRHPEIQLVEPMGTYVERVSGKSDDRDKYNALLRRISKGDIDFVMVKDLKRLNRSAELSAQMKNLAKEHNFQFILLSTGNIYNPNSSENRMLYGFESLMNEEVVYRQSEYGRVAHRQKCEQKILNRNNITFGYMWDEKEKDIVLNPETAPIVKNIFDLYVFSGYTTLQIRQYLSEQGLHYSAHTIRRWLCEEAYVGVFHLNKKGSELGVGAGQKTKRFMNPQELWVPVERPDLAIVEREVFELAQKIAKTRMCLYQPDKNGTVQGRFQGKYLFSSRIFCAECGSSYVHKYADRKQSISIYRDSFSEKSRDALQVCANENYRRLYEDDLKQICVKIINELLNANEHCFERVFKIVSEVICQNACNDKETATLQTKYNRLNKEREKLKKAFINASAGPLKTDLEGDYNRVSEQIRDIEEAMKKCLTTSEKEEIAKEQIEAVRRELGTMKMVDVGTLKRETINAFLHKFIVHKDGELEAMLNNPQVSHDNRGESTELTFLTFTYKQSCSERRKAMNAGKELDVKVKMQISA